MPREHVRLSKRRMIGKGRHRRGWTPWQHHGGKFDRPTGAAEVKRLRSDGWEVHVTEVP